MKTEVLMVLNSLTNGGIERVLYNIATGLNPKNFKVYIYIFDNSNDYYGRKLLEKGICVIDEFPQIRFSKKTNQHVLVYKRIKLFLKNNPQITAVHIHECNLDLGALLAAKFMKVPIICMHSHSAYSIYWNPKTFPLKSRVVIPFRHIFYKYIPNYKIGCSSLACRRLYGKTKGQLVIPNAVDFSVFNKESMPDKDSLQRKYRLNIDDINFIFIGRFAEEKNPIFLLQVFSRIAKEKRNAKITIVGYGELEKNIKEEIYRLKLESRVKIMPSDSNVPELLKASDYFISPSLFEGLGIVFIEAQLMGIPAFASDQVPREANLGMCEFIPIDKGADFYAKYVLEYINNPKLKEKTLDKNKVIKYDLKETTKTYEEIYQGKYSFQ